jgi:hypothetical protein
MSKAAPTNATKVDLRDRLMKLFEKTESSIERAPSYAVEAALAASAAKIAMAIRYMDTEDHCCPPPPV